MRVALYLRASTLKQTEEGYSLDYQREILYNYVKTREWEIVGEYEDAGESGRTIKRPAFNKMLEDAKNGKFETVLVYKLDRFSRSLQDLINVINLLKEQNVYVWSVTQSYDERTPEGRLMRNMLGSFAQFESEMIGVRVKDGMSKRAREGSWNTSPPFGYNILDKKLIINQNESKIVKEIYKNYMNGSSMDAISKNLNENGFKTKRNGNWNTNTVRRILNNPIYCGFFEYNETLIKGEHEPIVTIEEYNKIQRKRKKRLKNEKLRKLIPTTISKKVNKL